MYTIQTCNFWLLPSYDKLRYRAVSMMVCSEGNIFGTTQYYEKRWWSSWTTIFHLKKVVAAFLKAFKLTHELTCVCGRRQRMRGRNKIMYNIWQSRWYLYTSISYTKSDWCAYNKISYQFTTVWHIEWFHYCIMSSDISMLNFN